jgi:hypothetical protein
MYNIGEMRTDVCQRLLYHLKRNVAHKVIWFVLFAALNILTVRGVQAQEMQEPVWLQAISPQIHLELNPDIKITADIRNSPSISEDSVITLQDTPPQGETDSLEKIAAKIKEKNEPDWSGLKRDSFYFVGYQVVVVGILYFMPQKVSSWSEEQKESFTIDKWAENVGETGWDEDDWYLNYVFHPYWGATYYIRARERGLNKFDSFLYSAFLSTLYEFGIEALFEPPSVQDLIVTPCAGSLLGMYFEKVREKIKAKGDQQKWYDKVMFVLTDPLGIASKYTDRLLGIESSVRLKSFHSAPRQYEGINLTHMKSVKFVKEDTESISPVGVEVRLVW